MNDLKLSNPKDVVGSGKLPLELVPATVVAWLAVAFLEGALKYGRFNWRIAGVRASIYVAACLRHVWKWWNGEDRDPKTQVHHLANAAACLSIILDAELCGKLEDDRPPRAPVAELVDELAGTVTHLKELFKDHHPHQYTIADGEVVERSFDELWREAAGNIIADQEAQEERNQELTSALAVVPSGSEVRPGGIVVLPQEPSFLRRAWDWLIRNATHTEECSCWICAEGDALGLIGEIKAEEAEIDRHAFVGRDEEDRGPFYGRPAPNVRVGPFDTREEMLAGIKGYREDLERDEEPVRVDTFSCSPADGVTLGPFSTQEALDAALARFHATRMQAAAAGEGAVKLYPRTSLTAKHAWGHKAREAGAAAKARWGCDAGLD